MVEQNGNEGGAEMLLDTRASATGTATFSPEKPEPLYRYRLTRRWSADRPVFEPVLCWVMLNPSSASHDVNDATIRKVTSFSKREGYGGLIVVNLFAYRSTDPDKLIHAEDPIGASNEAMVLDAMRGSAKIVVAWGAMSKGLRAKSWMMRRKIQTAGWRLWALGTTKDGSPRHPLYIPGNQPLVEWKSEAA